VGGEQVDDQPLGAMRPVMILEADTRYHAALLPAQPHINVNDATAAAPQAAHDSHTTLLANR
jgi:hypothetical protein